MQKIAYLRLRLRPMTNHYPLLLDGSVLQCSCRQPDAVEHNSIQFIGIAICPVMQYGHKTSARRN